jgi:hypothetical protein
MPLHPGDFAAIQTTASRDGGLEPARRDLHACRVDFQEPHAGQTTKKYSRNIFPDGVPPWRTVRYVNDGVLIKKI